MVPGGSHIVVAVNPRASFGRGRHVGPMVVHALQNAGHRVTELIDESFDALQTRAKAAVDERPEALVVVGGDGMVGMGAGLVAGTGVPLAIVPSGTGNDMARGLGIPFDDPEEAVRHLLCAFARPVHTLDAGRVTSTDPETGQATTRWWAGMISAGFDSTVNERANRMTRPRGASRYTLALVLELLRLAPIRYRLTFDDDEPVELESMLLCVGNNVSLGGGMKVTPDARLDDGLLDVLTVEPLGRAAFARIFPRVFEGRHLSDPRVHVRRVKRLRIESPTAVIYADGERIGSAPVDIEVVPDALRILV